jgi:septal ring factor EnvC (AmiA/AmiB activator)
MSGFASFRRGQGPGKLAHIAAAFFTISLIALSAPHSAPAQERVDQQDAKKQLQDRKRDLDAARDREKAISGDLAKLAEERATLNENLIGTARKVQASETKLSSIETKLEALSEQEVQVRASIGERHAIITRLLAAMQRIGRQPPPALVTRRNDALKMVRSAMLMASVFPELKTQADGLKTELDDLVRFGESIRQERDNLKSENDKLIAARDAIGVLIAEKKALEKSRQQKLAKIRKAAKRHASDVTYLGELVQRMDKEIAAAGLAQYEAEIAAKRAQEKALVEAAKKQGIIQEAAKKEKKTKVAFLSPGRLKPAMEFRTTKGKLARPVSGRQIRNFGGANGSGEKAKGISIASRSNAQVISPVDGWVAYADEFRTYGQLLIINAGGGYHVLLAGMQRIDVGIGQFVLAGEPVAVMGASAQNDKAKDGGDKTSRPGQVLYVEFRKNGRSIDPGPWWARIPERGEG